MKVAEDFLKEWEDFSDLKNLPRKMILKAMEEYAQYKVNELNKSDVIKSVCDHSHWNEIWTKGKAWKQCLKCGKRWKQTVL